MVRRPWIGLAVATLVAVVLDPFGAASGAPNQAPLAAPDALTGHAGEFLPVPPPGVLANDSDPDGNLPLSVMVVDGFDHADSYVLSPTTGELNYQPSAGYLGTDVLTYKVVDSLGAESEPTTVTITLTNAPPIAAPDDYTVPAGQGFGVTAPGLLANDSDPDGDDIEVEVVTPWGHAAYSDVKPDGEFAYSAEPGFAGVDELVYRTVDEFGAASQPTTVHMLVTVPQGNLTPVAADDQYVTGESTPLHVAAPGVLANDHDPDGTFLVMYSVIEQPTHGTVAVSHDGGFDYLPDPGFTGTDSFTYLLSDYFPEDAAVNADTTATVTITVEPGASTPPPRQPPSSPPAAPAGPPAGALPHAGA